MPKMMKIHVVDLLMEIDYKRFSLPWLLKETQPPATEFHSHCFSVRVSVRQCVRVFYDRQTTCSVTLLAPSVLTGFATNLEVLTPINSVGQPQCDISNLLLRMLAA